MVCVARLLFLVQRKQLLRRTCLKHFTSPCVPVCAAAAPPCVLAPAHRGAVGARRVRAAGAAALHTGAGAGQCDARCPHSVPCHHGACCLMVVALRRALVALGWKFPNQPCAVQLLNLAMQSCLPCSPEQPNNHALVCRRCRACAPRCWAWACCLPACRPRWSGWVWWGSPLSPRCRRPTLVCRPCCRRCGWAAWWGGKWVESHAVDAVQPPV